MKTGGTTTEAMDVAVSIERDIPSKITGANRVFIRAVIARAITNAVAAEREACAGVAEHLNGWGSDCGKGGHAEHIAAVIRARGAP